MPLSPEQSHRPRNILFRAVPSEPARRQPDKFFRRRTATTTTASERRCFRRGPPFGLSAPAPVVSCPRWVRERSAAQSRFLLSRSLPAVRSVTHRWTHSPCEEPLRGMTPLLPGPTATEPRRRTGSHNRKQARHSLGGLLSILQTGATAISRANSVAKHSSSCSEIY